MVFLELRRDSRVTTGNSGCLLCWPWEVQIPRADKNVAGKDVIRHHVLYKGNVVGRIKGAKDRFDLQFLTWDFSLDAVAGKGFILR